MAFDKVDQAVPNFPALEAKILKLWKERDVFARSLRDSERRPEFVFYEGPPTANGLPHNGHVLTRVIKDLFPRYMTMRGYHVERRAGWDTHGLPVEVEVEKALRIQGKSAILEYGVDRFARKCLESVFRYTAEWEHLTERIGFWVDLDTAYVTFHKTYVESVWWALSLLFKQGLLYQGHKVVWWWAQGGTALSSGEVGNAYKTVDDPSVYVRFKLKDEDAALVVWTTTPWTLPSNMFAAVHAELPYAYVRAEDGTLLVVAEALVEPLSEKWGTPLEVQKVVQGRALIGKRYEPPFESYNQALSPDDDRYFRVVAGDRATAGPPQWFVTLDAGTGIVHLAPAFGEDDWKVWRNERRAREDIELFCHVRPDGCFDDKLSGLALEGTFVKDGDKRLVRALKEQGLLVHQETYRHEYPFCWRSEQDPLIQYARSAWFIKTTAKIDQVIENNQQVTWAPEHVRDGRFGDFLDGNVDWALSRERFWGTPLNIWMCDRCDAMCAPGSVREIEEKNPQAFRHFEEARAQDPSLSEHLLVHKPWIDQVELPCQACGSTMRRVPDVIDCWFDSGCMPFAQLGYPHQEGSSEAFERAFPADFISEAIDQTRGWFYSLMTVSNLVFGDRPQPHPYRRCIVLGHVLDKAGKKESKSAGNYTPPEVILDAVRMEFSLVPSDTFPKAKIVPPKKGTAFIGQEDFDGLDLRPKNDVALYRKETPAEKRRVRLVASKHLPRRVVILSEEDREALGLTFGPTDVFVPAEVPKLPSDERVMIEADETPAPGADAFRWFFYASNPPWNNVRHALSNVRGLQKELPLKLRNVYSFFVTYANIDRFDPLKDEESKRLPMERGLLDRWVLSELEKTKKKVVEHMDALSSYEAASVLNEFVEGLSNWYVRRSRERFWAEGRDQDKLDAYWTLYQVLTDLCLLVAPFLPFAAEEIYQNLVYKQYGDGQADSVHLRLYPNFDAARIDEGLSKDMAEVRSLVSLGLQVRAKSKLKIRQPLKEAKLVLADGSRVSSLKPYLEIMREELNTQSVRFIDRPDDFVSYRLKPNFQALGKRLGSKMKATQAAIREADPAQLKAELTENAKVVLAIGGESVTLTPDELVIAVEAKEGFLAAGDGVGVVVLDTKLDEALIEEGMFREVLSKVQGLRKDLKLDYAARISLALFGSSRLVSICQSRAELLKQETLATTLLFEDSGSGEEKTLVIEDERLTLKLVDLGVPEKR